MVTVEFRSVGAGKCRWCKKDRDEVFDLAFGDGSFVGRYCFADFKKALLDKLESEPHAQARKADAAPSAQARPAGNGPPAAVPVAPK